MSILFVFHILGALLTCLALTLLLPIPFSYYYHDGSATAFIWAASICLAVGMALMKLFKNKKELS
ncbi:TrkH family potassium uptake protein, partial [Desulfuromonas acetoxidans]|nr:TrkH family potassium uptake protein [Desulfuromonas acetoxidans]